MKKILSAVLSAFLLLSLCACGNDDNGHIPVKQEARAASCTVKGIKEHWVCSFCGKLFLDEACTQETTLEAQTIAKLSHDYDETNWGYKGEDGHAHACSCGAHQEVEPHQSAGAATETTPELCGICGYQIAPMLGHTHVANTKWEYNDVYHWNYCNSGDNHEMNKAKHSYSGDCDTMCDCGYERITMVQHTYDNSCDDTCNGCDETREAGHSYTSDCDTTCDRSDCGFVREPLANHSFDTTQWGYKTKEGHAHKCACGEHDTLQDHVDGNDDDDCDECGVLIGDWSPWI